VPPTPSHEHKSYPNATGQAYNTISCFTNKTKTFLHAHVFKFLTPPHQHTHTHSGLVVIHKDNEVYHKEMDVVLCPEAIRPNMLINFVTKHVCGLCSVFL